MNPALFRLTAFPELTTLRRQMAAATGEGTALGILDRLGSPDAVKLFAQVSRLHLRMILLQVASGFAGLSGGMLAVLWSTNAPLDGISLLGGVLCAGGLLTALRLQFLRQPVSQLQQCLTPLTKQREAEMAVLVKQYKACQKRLSQSKSRRNVLLELDLELVRQAVPESARPNREDSSLPA